jgi:hypothetical protein
MDTKTNSEILKQRPMTKLTVKPFLLRLICEYRPYPIKLAAFKYASGYFPWIYSYPEAE